MSTEEVNTEEENSIEMFDEQPSDDDYGESFQSFDDNLEDDDDNDDELDTKSVDIDEKAIDKLGEDNGEEDDEEDLIDEDEESDDDKEDEVEGEEKAQVKTIKGKLGDESHDIPEEATVKVMVDGKPQYPTIQELRDNFSGKRKWTEEIETAKNEATMAKRDKELVENDKQEVMTHVTAIGDMVKKAIAGEGSPLSAMEYLINLTGGNVYEYNKLMVEKFTPMIRELDDYSEEAKEAFWLKLENEHIKSNHAAKMKKHQDSEGLKEKESELTKLRESHGVSHDKFILAQEELKSIDSDRDWTNEEVIKYVQVVPLYERTGSIMSKFSKLIEADKFESVQDDLVKYLQEDPEATDEEIKSILSDALSIENIAKPLKEKVIDRSGEKRALKTKKKTSQSYESFDDYSDDY